MIIIKFFAKKCQTKQTHITYNYCNSIRVFSFNIKNLGDVPRF